ncbi:hypothetical protein EG329_007585, partial [Mollisiaceae sp. DMI_Dod_QoI]
MDLNSCLEWRILQRIASGVVGRLATHKYRRGRKAAPRQAATHSIAFENNLAFLETELREILKWRVPQTVSQAVYDDLGTKLKRLCTVLEGAVNLSFVTPNITGDTQPVAEQTKEGDVQSYSNFRALLEYLNDSSENADTCDLDIAKGPNPTLFCVRDPHRAKIALEAAHDCNDALVHLCKKAQNSAQHTMTPSETESSAESQIQSQERTNEVLRSLFGVSSCDIAHEVLLCLSDDIYDSQAPPTLSMFLSCCSHPGAWQQAKCLPYAEHFRVGQIRNICEDLENWARGELFQILHEYRGLFHALDDIPPISSLSIDPDQSLGHYIEKGAFLRNDREKPRPGEFFSPREKQTLALKLARCLLGFLDSESTSPSWNSGKVYLLTPPGVNPRNAFLYLAFKRGNDHSPAFTIEFADPVLLEFAKLLLEIDLGITINLSQCQDRQAQWGTLCKLLYDSQLGGSGLYAEAVKGCLYLHNEFVSRPNDEDPKVFLRRIIRQEVVGKLEMALNPPTASSGKRRREESDDTPTPHKGALSKRQRIDMAEPRSREGQRYADPLPQPLPTTIEASIRRRSTVGRMTVFRVREVPLRDQVSICDIVTNIIRKNMSDSEKASIKFVVKDITRSTIKYSSSTTGKRGTALVIFRGLVPEPFKAVMKSSDDSDVFVNSEDEEELSIDLDTKFIGATQLYEPQPNVEIVADIIAIHGLNGHPYGSWLSKSAKPKMWLTDFLHEDADSCRIIIYGYKSNIFDEQEQPRHELFNQAERLNATLNNIRNTPELQRRPIIFVAHSYGGLVLARTLVEAQTRRRPLLEATKALFLFACPSRGFHVQDILNTMSAELEAAGKEPISDDKAAALVRRLGEGDFRSELASYPDVVLHKKVYSFVETRKTETVTRQSGQVRRDGNPVMAAGPNSVILGLPNATEEVIPTDKDHSDIVKFASRGDPTYEDVKCRIQAEVASLKEQ